MELNRLPTSWRKVLADQFSQPYFTALAEFVAAERSSHTIYPREENVFAAYELTPFERVRVLILGQDPYHGPNQAHGLCFSVDPGTPIPPSLGNVFRELERDLGIARPAHGCLREWAQQGVLLLNAVLTVRDGEPNSHKNRGWEKFTDATIQALVARPAPVIFLLWGGYAQKKRRWIDLERHRILEAAHPSPLSVHQGFFGSRPFSRVNAILAEWGETPISWSLG